MSGRVVLLIVWLVGSAAWGTLIWQRAVATAPRLSLDMPARDPAVRAALEAAQSRHRAQHLAAGLVPPILVLASGALVLRRRG